MIRVLLLLLALVPLGCRAAPPPAPAPGVGIAPAPSAPTPTRASPAPADVGITLGPGRVLSYQVQKGELATLLVANTSAAESVFGYMVEPRAGAPTPSKSPTAEPGGKPGAPRPPFGFGFSAADRDDRVPLTSRRRALAAEARETQEPLEPLVPGVSQTFWVNNGDTTLAGDRERRARLRLVTPHAYFFVDEAGDVTIDQAALDRMAKTFESEIRPALIQAFGGEPAVGLDGDPRLFIVFSPWVGQAEGRKGMMGYFWPRDPVARGGTGADLRQHANEKEVLFLSPDLLAMPDVTAFGTLAHEYQHLLMFSAKTRIDGTPRTEETWLDEGFSMVAMDLAGFGLMGGDHFVAEEIAAFQNAPSDYSLTDWNNNPNGFSYGVSYLFVRYLLDRFGLGLIQEVQQTPEVGIAGLEKVLAPRGVSFAEVFVDWALANRPQAPEARVVTAYSWFNPLGTFGEVQLPGTQVTRLDAPGSIKVRPWGVSFLECEADSDRARSLTLMNATHPVQIVGGSGGSHGNGGPSR